MAIVNDDKKFIFFHLYKCGGTSLRTLLNENIKGSQEIISGHALPRDVKYYYYYRGAKYQKIFDKMFKFTIVRNPFDFLLSTYHYAIADTTHYWHNIVINMDFNDFPMFYMKQMEKDNAPELKYVGKNKITTPYEFIRDYDGKVIVDFVGKLENINHDMNLLLNKIGMPAIEMPKENVNANNNKPYQEVYNQKSRAFVEQHFAKDLEYFGYQF